MITVELAQRLKSAGLAWTPSPGDRFVVPDRDLDDLVFAVSDMVVEVMNLPTGRLFAFNGTTEWALDSIEQRHVVWLPAEDQLRSLLGESFVALESTPGGYIVRIGRNGTEERHIDIEAECAYARAVHSVLGHSADDQPDQPDPADPPGADGPGQPGSPGRSGSPG